VALTHNADAYVERSSMLCTWRRATA
jgi:hypothetical protein